MIMASENPNTNDQDDDESDEDGLSTDVKEYTSETVLSPGMTSVTLVDPGLDARAEIANYNHFMDEIFRRMNGAIKAKRLDPMDLRLESTADNEVSRKRGLRSANSSQTHSQLN